MQTCFTWLGKQVLDQHWWSQNKWGFSVKCIPLPRLHIQFSLGRYLSKARSALLLHLLFAWTSSLTEVGKHECFICSFELHPFSGHGENKTRHKWLMQNLGRKYCRVPCCLITSLGISQHFHNSKPIYTCFPTVMWRHNLI